MLASGTGTCKALTANHMQPIPIPPRLVELGRAVLAVSLSVSAGWWPGQATLSKRRYSQCLNPAALLADNPRRFDITN